MASAHPRRHGPLSAVRAASLPVLAALAVTLLVAAAQPLAAAQGPGGPGRGFAAIPGLNVTASASSLALDPGNSGTLTFHVANGGNASLNLTFRAVDRPMRGGFAGAGAGAPPPGNRSFNRSGNGSFRGGNRSFQRPPSDLNFTATPAGASLAPGASMDVTLTIAVASNARPATTHNATFIAFSNATRGAAAAPFAVHVGGTPATASGANFSSVHSTPAAKTPSPSIAWVLAVVAAAALTGKAFSRRPARRAP
ncbi:MAG: hypothetical protein ACYDCK_05785 [Thermoplasmatota archaeon]